MALSARQVALPGAFEAAECDATTIPHHANAAREE